MFNIFHILTVVTLDGNFSATWFWYKNILWQTLQITSTWRWKYSLILLRIMKLLLYWVRLEIKNFFLSLMNLGQSHLPEWRASFLYLSFLGDCKSRLYIHYFLCDVCEKSGMFNNINSMKHLWNKVIPGWCIYHT